MEEEGGIVLSVIRDDSYEIVHGRSTPSRVHNAVENVTQSEGRSHGRENVHDMLQRWPFAVPYNPDGNDFRSVHQRSTDLDFGPTGTLKNERNRFQRNPRTYTIYSRNSAVTFRCQYYNENSRFCIKNCVIK